MLRGGWDLLLEKGSGLWVPGCHLMLLDKAWTTAMGHQLQAEKDLLAPLVV